MQKKCSGMTKLLEIITTTTMVASEFEKCFFALKCGNLLEHHKYRMSYCSVSAVTRE
jgi:hypothetical protein